MSSQIPIEPFSIPSDGESYPVGPGGQRPPAEPPSSGPPPPPPRPSEPEPPESPATPDAVPRRRSRRTAVVAVTSVVALLLGFGIGAWVTHPAVTKAESQRDTARQHLATTNKQLATTSTQAKSLQDQLTAATAKVQSCQSLSTTATKVFTDWDTLVAASHAFDATAPGSPAEAQAGAELDRQFRSLDLEMQSAKQALAKCAPASNA